MLEAGGITVADRLEAAIVRLLSGTGGQADDEIHLGLNDQPLPGPAFGRQDFDLAGAAVDIDMHEDVEGDGNVIAFDAVRLERTAQIAVAAVMRVSVAINNAERVAATGGEQEIVTSDIVFHDVEHDVAAVGIKWMPGGEKQRLIIIKGTAGREIFLCIMQIVA